VKSINIFAALLMLGTAAIAQTTPVTPVISNGNVQVTVGDSSGGSHSVKFPITAVTTLSVGVGTDSYTPPVAVEPPPSGAPAIPANATTVSLITGGKWKAPEHDAGTPGTGSGSNNYPVTGIFSDDARAFSMVYSGAGGVRWANSFANDVKSTHFVLDINVLSPDFTHVADLEMDTNAVLSNGKTAILGTQCASQEGTWDITFSDSTGAWHWSKTNVPCNPLTWAPNTPHHIRIFGIITATGISTYQGVEFDGVYSAFTNGTGSTADPLGWSKGTLLTNLQIDGYKASGSATVYADKFNIIRW
jgi:hypothetical protein